MKKIFLSFSLLILNFSGLWACPGCAGGVAKTSNPYSTLWILSIFIVLTYIPFYLLFRAAKKYEPKVEDGN